MYFFMKRLTGIKLNKLELTKTAVMIATFAAATVGLSNLPNITVKLLLPGTLGALVLYIMYRRVKNENI